MKGCGPVLTRNIVAAFGERAVNVLNGADAALQLARVPGIGKKTAARMKADWDRGRGGQAGPAEADDDDDVGAPVSRIRELSASIKGQSAQLKMRLNTSLTVTDAAVSGSSISSETPSSGAEPAEAGVAGPAGSTGRSGAASPAWTPEERACGGLERKHAAAQAGGGEAASEGVPARRPGAGQAAEQLPPLSEGLEAGGHRPNDQDLAGLNRPDPVHQEHGVRVELRGIRELAGHLQRERGSERRNLLQASAGFAARLRGERG